MPQTINHRDLSHTDRPSFSNRQSTPMNRWLAIILSCSLGIMLVSGCQPVPQVLNDEAAFGELDALYTAVTSKRRDLLDACRKRISKLHEEKRMSDAGFDEIEEIVALTEQDKWTPAAEQLYNFMRGQRKP
ncbi:MAG: hypothetical protein V4719_27800 [Planctomycetota bacterium]